MNTYVEYCWTKLRKGQESEWHEYHQNEGMWCKLTDFNYSGSDDRYCFLLFRRKWTYLNHVSEENAG